MFNTLIDLGHYKYINILVCELRFLSGRMPHKRRSTEHVLLHYFKRKGSTVFPGRLKRSCLNNKMLPLIRSFCIDVLKVLNTVHFAGFP